MLLLSFFMTVNAQIATIPYSCNFDDAAENSKWVIPSSVTTNKWVIENTTSNSLICLAKENGTTPVYREFNTVAGQEYIVTFYWKVTGELDYDWGSPFDALRVYWVDNPSVNISDWATQSSVAPAAALQYQKYQVSRKTSFPQQCSFRVSGNGSLAKLVFLWTNNVQTTDLSGSIEDVTITTLQTPAATIPSIHINQTSPYNTYTPDELVKNVFVEGGQCLVSNVTHQGLGWNGSSWTSTTDRSLAYFDNGTMDGLGMVSGLLMCTGKAYEAEGPNSDNNTMDGGESGYDSDLASLIPGGNIHTVTKLEFDMIPYTDHLSFQYIFASKEYPVFSCSSYNDVFGFFISGPGISGNQNIALLPYSTTPVSINTVHPAYYISCSAVNLQYYVDGAGNTYTNFNGRTVLLPTAPVTVIPGQTYHLKLAIANVSDNKYGSGVFLLAGSLDLGSQVVNAGAGIENMDNVFAGCEQNSFTINLFPFPSEVAVTLSYSGAAVNDVVSPDGSPLPTSITVPPGTSSINIPYIVNSPVTVNGGDFNINVTVEYCSEANAVTKTIYVYDKISTPPQFSVESTCDSPTGILNVSINNNEGSPALSLSVDDGNSWHHANNYSGTVPVGTQQILFRDSISCSIDTFNVVIPYITSSDTIVFDTINGGEAYTVPPFNLPPQSELGDYFYSVTLPNANMYGCDSTVNLYLTVNEILVDFSTLNEICADEPRFDINFDVVAGRATTYSVLFDNKAHAAGFVDQINQVIVDQSIPIPMPTDVRPNYYTATVRLSDGNMQKDFKYEFSVLYASSVITQRWNDVLALLNQNFNGGYQWSSYQWYKDGEAIPNENGSYLYVGAKGEVLDTTAYYRVLLTRIDDGVKLFTCAVQPIYNENQYLTVRPTLASPYQPITIIFADGKRATLWNVLGVQVAQYQLTNGINTIYAPNEPGTYILKIETKQGEMRTEKITVQ